jgi:hypothetical protein
LHFNQSFTLCGRQSLFCIAKKSNQKTLVQKKAIAVHRSFSSQNAFSIALIMICLFISLKTGDRRTFDSSFTIACFLNGIPNQWQSFN